MAVITKNKIVGIFYEVEDGNGNTIDSNRGFAPLEYLHGSTNILPALEDELEGLTVNEEKLVTLIPSQTYGEYDSTLLYQVDAEKLYNSGQQLQEGLIIEFEGKELMIAAIHDGKISLNGNHFLAGKTLSYHVKIISIRSATAEEIELGYPILPQKTACGLGCNC